MEQAQLRLVSERIYRMEANLALDILFNVKRLSAAGSRLTDIISTGLQLSLRHFRVN